MNTELATIPSTAIIMNDGKTTADGKTIQQRVKLGDNRILYATNLKNRGQLVTQKVLNIVPIGHPKNNILSTGSVTTSSSGANTGLQPGQTINVVSAAPFTKTGHMIQRVATINNSQNIRANNTGSSGGVGGGANVVTPQQQKVIGLVSTAPAAVVDVNQTANAVKIIQTNDNNSVSGININTSNR